MSRRRTELAWAFAESANEPWFNLVQRYVFVPYLAATLAVGEGEGAGLVGLALGSAGVAIAILAPTLGSIADGGARRRLCLAAAGLLGFVAAASLWFAAPGVPLWPVLLAIVAGTIAVELMVQFTNSLLPAATTPDRYGLLSGAAFGLSQLAGILALLIILGLSRAMPDWLAAVPHAVDRLAGPVAAAAIILFLLPLLMVAREPPALGEGSVAQGLGDLGATLKAAWVNRPIRWFLVGRMVTADGMAIVFSFGAVLAAATFGWTADSLAVFGLIITVFGVVGGFMAAWLDGRLGARPILFCGIGLMAAGVAMVLVTDEHRLLGVETGVVPGVPLASPQEQGFLAAGAVIALGAALAISAMRTMMALLAPPGQSAAYFGLYAFVGKATAFVGPYLVGAVALATGSVRPGIALALLFFAIGGMAFLVVRPPRPAPVPA